MNQFMKSINTSINTYQFTMELFNHKNKGIAGQARNNGAFAKRIARNFTFAIIALLLPACDPIDTDETYSYTSLNIKVLFSEATYLFTYNGDTVQWNPAGFYKPLTIARKDLTGTLRACRGETPELDTLLHLEPAATLSFIQLPGEKIKFYSDSDNDEPEPADESCTKLRLTYSGDYNAADSLRFVWLCSKKANLSLPGATAETIDTLMLYKNRLSRYLELDTDKYSAEGANTYFFYIRQTWNGSAWTGTAKTKITSDATWTAEYRFATYQISNTGWLQLLFGTK
jgi:hypothetical protein